MNNNKDNKGVEMPFTMKNYITILVGMALLLLGFVLMSGGGEHTATEFDESIFSFRRITLAPVVVIAGFVVVGVAIMKRFNQDKE
jgi:NADH:ubiquinone oxidoreductase subunit K